MRIFSTGGGEDGEGGGDDIADEGAMGAHFGGDAEAEEGVGEETGEGAAIAVGRDFAEASGVAEGAVKEGLGVLAGAAAHLAGGGVMRGEEGDGVEDEAAAGLGEGLGASEAEGLADAGEAGGGAGGEEGEVLLRFVLEALEGQGEEFFLAAEGVVEAGAVDAGGVDEVLDGGGFVAFFPEQAGDIVEGAIGVELAGARHGKTIVGGRRRRRGKLAGMALGWPAFAVGALLGLPAGFAPGPMLTLVITQTLRHGVREGLKVALAPLVSDAPIVGLTVWVLAGVGQARGVIGAIALGGAAFLVWLGVECLRTRGVAGEQGGAAPRSVGKAVMVNLLNPHPYLFWFGVGGPLLLRWWREGAAEAGAFLAGFYVCLVGSKVLFAVLTGRGRDLLLGGAYVWIMRGLGVALLVFAALFVREGVGLLGGGISVK